MKSPLRYPGGKTRAITSLTYILNTYYSSYKRLVSPFCGGCSFEFSIKDRFEELVLNDKFEPLINFYTQCKVSKDKLAEELRKLLGTVSSDVFATYRRTVMDETDLMTKAIKYFVINRCSFSGATLSGGFSEESSKARFTESSISNIERLDLTHITFSCKDFSSLIPKFNDDDTPTFIFCDPPYMLSEGKNKLYGENGDLHESFDHEAFHRIITASKHDWMITYNDSPRIRELYKDYTVIPASWAYGMNASKKSSEIIILNKTLPKGGIPHICGNMYEMESLKYLQDLGFKCERAGGSSKNPDIVVNDNIVIECKNSLKGVDYKEYKLELKDGKYVCDNPIINKYIPTDLFEGKEIPKGISSVKWNKIKKPTFSDVYVECDDLKICDIMDAKYIFINGCGKFRTSEDDPLNLELPLFEHKFKIRLYVKNHSSHSAKKCNLSAVATIRI